MAPNLRRSCVTEWRWQSTQRRVRHSTRGTVSSMSCVTHAYDLFMPARMPTGASLVILIDIWRSPMGMPGWGSAVTHTRNSACTSSSLTMFCSSSIRYLMPKCVFWSSTHPPEATDVVMYLRATISWPCPIDTESTSFLRFLASCVMISVGSDPGVRMKMKGTLSGASTRSQTSWCVASRLRGKVSVYLVSSASWMYSSAAIMVRSVRTERTRSILCILSRRSSMSGTGTASGASWSYHWRQRDSLRATMSGSSLKRGIDMESWMMLSHTPSGTHSLGFFLTALMSRAAPPLVKHPKWSMVMISLCSCSLRARRSV
mmetsp:Transcript_24277/g.61115  ORF Transcript_24277/g.61115 Transcript_24277/m.61115 type:complete len:316 (-) Transcript_24277:1456-2403(-)